MYLTRLFPWLEFRFFISPHQQLPFCVYAWVGNNKKLSRCWEVSLDPALLIHSLAFWVGGKLSSWAAFVTFLFWILSEGKIAVIYVHAECFLSCSFFALLIEAPFLVTLNSVRCHVWALRRENEPLGDFRVFCFGGNAVALAWGAKWETTACCLPVWRYNLSEAMDFKHTLVKHLWFYVKTKKQLQKIKRE